MNEIAVKMSKEEWTQLLMALEDYTTNYVDDVDVKIFYDKIRMVVDGTRCFHGYGRVVETSAWSLEQPPEDTVKCAVCGEEMSEDDVEVIIK